MAPGTRNAAVRNVKISDSMMMTWPTPISTPMKLSAIQAPAPLPTAAPRGSGKRSSIAEATSSTVISRMHTGSTQRLILRL